MGGKIIDTFSEMTFVDPPVEESLKLNPVSHLKKRGWGLITGKAREIKKKSTAAWGLRKVHLRRLKESETR